MKILMIITIIIYERLSDYLCTSYLIRNRATVPCCRFTVCKQVIYCQIKREAVPGFRSSVPDFFLLHIRKVVLITLIFGGYLILAKLAKRANSAMHTSANIFDFNTLHIHSFIEVR